MLMHTGEVKRWCFLVDAGTGSLILTGCKTRQFATGLRGELRGFLYRKSFRQILHIG